MPPNNPGPTPIIEGGLAESEIATQKNHKDHLREHEYHKGVYNALKKIITGAEKKILASPKEHVHWIHERIHPTNF